MKKLSFILLSLLCSSLCFGQNQKFEFKTKFYDAIDKWVAFETNKDSAYIVSINKWVTLAKYADPTYIVGFLYFDPDFGFAFRQEMVVKETKDGLKRVGQRKNVVTPIIHPDTVAILSDETIARLRLPKEPDWLKNYNRNSKSYYLQLGSQYNFVGASHHAIEPLLKIYEKKPHFKGLELELAIAYYDTGQFDKAIAVLNKAIEKRPRHAALYNVLGLLLTKQNKIDEAEKAFLRGMELSKKNSEKAMMASNMAFHYFSIRDKSKFDEWAALARKYADANSRYYRNLKHAEENWDKEDVHFENLKYRIWIRNN